MMMLITYDVSTESEGASGACGGWRAPAATMVSGDGSQSLYRKRDFTWADAGIHASGRVINRKFDLDRNYRNTRSVTG